MPTQCSCLQGVPCSHRVTRDQPLS
ncbi:SWIM zinc finger family protein [Aurantiacibacter sp. D1-12]